MPTPPAPKAHSAPSAPATALLAGSTGLIGRELAAQWAGPGVLHLLVRRPLPDPGALRRVQVVDFAALPALPAADAAYCCLGTTIKAAGSRAAFRGVDFDAVLAFARAARAAGVRRYAVVSALGASPSAGGFYSRVKGEMEAALAAVGFPSLVIVRPSLLTGDRAALGQPPRSGEQLALALTAPLARLIPKAWRPIAAATVARAMLRALDQARPGVRIIESAELQELGA
jgi:uncharacterized protein YbjT (DUF2867 family)